MIQFLIQTVLKSMSALSCLAVILSDAAALAGIFMGYPIVKMTQLKDPIMAAIFGGFLLGSTFVDIFNQGIGLIFALCYEMKWMLRLYVGLMLLTVIMRGSVIFRPPVSGLKSAPFLGRQWSSINTPYDQMDKDIIKFYSQSPSLSNHSSLATFEKKLKCCGVNDPEDYNAKVAKPLSCLPGGLPGVNVLGNITIPDISTGNITIPGLPTTNVSAGLAAGKAAVEKGTTSGGVGGKVDALVNAGKEAIRTGCKARVWALWEGSKIAFDATVSAISFSILTVLLTVAWCEFFGDGLITGIQWCQPIPKPV